MSTLHLAAPKIKGAVTRVWGVERRDTQDFLARLRRFTRWFKTHGVQIAEANRKQEKDYQLELARIQESI